MPVPSGRPTLRSDARRSRAAVLRSAMQLLGDRPEATLEEVASAAGVSRQTVYAHFRSRRDLRAAVVQQATDDYLAALDAARLDEGPAADALGRFVSVSTDMVRSSRPLYAVLAEATSATDAEAAHAPVRERIVGLVRRGQRSGEFARGLSPDWLATATIALGHAVTSETWAGRMTERHARQTLLRSLSRLYGVS